MCREKGYDVNKKEFFQNVKDEGFVQGEYPSVLVSEKDIRVQIMMYDKEGQLVEEAYDVSYIEVWANDEIRWDGKIEDMYSPFVEYDVENDKKHFVDFDEIIYEL